MTAKKRIIRRRPQSRTAVWQDLCWGGLQGGAFVQCVVYDEALGKDRVHASELIAWPQDRGDLDLFISEHFDCDRLHAGPLLRDEKSAHPRRDEATLPGRVCWAEVDRTHTVDEVLGLLDGLDPVVVESGGPGHHHVYIQLDGTHPPEKIREANRALQHRLGADSGFAPSKLLGIPGTHNRKERYRSDAGFPKVRFVHRPDHCDGVPIDDILDLQEARMMERQTETAVGPGRDEIPGHLWDLISQPPGKKRNSQTYRAVASLWEYGCTREQILARASQMVAGLDKFGDRLEAQIDVMIENHRQDHPHEGWSCAQASCEHAPDWLRDAHDSERPFPYTPPLQARDLLARSTEVQWLIPGLLPDLTYGWIAGHHKTFKSIVALDLAISVVAGTEFLGHFPVSRPSPVLIYVNEGSAAEIATRINRLLATHGIDPESDVPLYVRTSSPSCDSPAFEDQLLRDLRLLSPGLVILDAWYTFHGAKTDPTNMMQEGALLRQVSAPCGEAGASLLIVNHFAKSAPKSLRSENITMSAAAAWYDTALLLGLSFYDDRDATLKMVAEGRSIGRQQFDVRIRGGMRPESDVPLIPEVFAATDGVEKKILDILAEADEPLGASKVRELVRGSNEKIQATLKRLVKDGEVVRVNRGQYTLVK